MRRTSSRGTAEKGRSQQRGTRQRRIGVGLHYRRSMSQNLHHYNIKAVEVCKPSKRQLRPMITVLAISTSKSPPKEAKSFPFPTRQGTYVLQLASSPTSCHVSWLRLRAAKLPLDTSPSRLYAILANAKLIVVASGKRSAAGSFEAPDRRVAGASLTSGTRRWRSYRRFRRERRASFRQHWRRIWRFVEAPSRSKLSPPRATVSFCCSSPAGSLPDDREDNTANSNCATPLCPRRSG